MNRVYNFSAGPATLPTEVLIEARDELLNYNNTGMSAMEISHRSKDFIAIAEQTTQLVRRLLKVPESYHVLFLQGGATSQFSMVPLNLLNKNKKADYLQTGLWGKKAIAEAKRYGDINIATNSEVNQYTHIAPQDQWQLDQQASYVHYTPNETINGVEFHDIPETNGVPLVADMSSNILSKPIDVNRFALIYAGAQKNIGPAGITLVIVREDLIGQAATITPLLYNYETHIKAQDHLYNTPPTYCLYIVKLALQWLERQGGVGKIAEINQRKAKKLYDTIDQSDFYQNSIAANCRSNMNIPFTLATDDLNTKFLQQATQVGLANLKGHRLVGGMRASIYNAMPEAGVEALIDFMKNFEKTQS